MIFRRIANGIAVVAGLAVSGVLATDVSERGWVKQAVAASAVMKGAQQRDEYIKALPKHRQAKYYRLLGQQKPGHECFFTNKAYHVVWGGFCQYNHEGTKLAVPRLDVSGPSSSDSVTSMPHAQRVSGATNDKQCSPAEHCLTK